MVIKYDQVPQDDPFKQAFYAYAKTRRGLITFNYDMIEAVLKRLNYYAPPVLTESTLKREYTKTYGSDMKKEIDFVEYHKFLNEKIVPLHVKGKSCTVEEAEKKYVDGFMNNVPKDINEKIIKTF